MIMADILKWFLLILGVMLVFLSYWVVAEALFPRFVLRTHECYKRPVKLTLIGLAINTPVNLLGILLLNQNNPAVKLFGAVFVGVPIVLGLLGSSGLAQRVGHGLPTPGDAAQPWRRVLRGGSVLTLTFLLPIVGWFVILPWTLISGFAAALSSFKSRPAETVAAAPVTASAPAEKELVS